MTTKEKIARLTQEEHRGMKAPFHPLLMHFAARYIGKTYSEFAQDHTVLVEGNIRCLEDFNLDAVGLISDPMREAAAFGANVIFPEDGVPYATDHLVETLDDVKALAVPDFYAAERTRDRIEGVKHYQERLGGKVPVVGWVEGPLAEACGLVGVSEMLMKIVMEEEFTNRLLDVCFDAAKEFARIQIEEGCAVIGVGDAICSQISPELYETYVKERHAELCSFIKSQGAMMKLHICGNTTHLLPHVATFAPDIYDVDWMVEMETARKMLGDDVILCGNVDPAAVIERMSRDEVYGACRDLVGANAGNAFILSAGCEVPAATRHENLFAMHEARC